MAASQPRAAPRLFASLARGAALTEANALTLTSLARLACCAMTLGLLSACATAPKVSSQVESSRYRAHASRNYTAPGPASDPWGPYIKEASAKFDVPEKWIREVMRQESGGRLYGRNGGLITSGAGAMGLMQVMPGTYDELRAPLHRARGRPLRSPQQHPRRHGVRA